MADKYEINPWVTTGGGLVGLGLGALAYRLGEKKSTGRLAAHLLIGAGLGAGAGALATLSSPETRKAENEAEEEAKVKSEFTDAEIARELRPWATKGWDFAGGAAGAGASRIGREVAAATGKTIANRVRSGESLKAMAEAITFNKSTGRYMLGEVDVTDFLKNKFGVAAKQGKKGLKVPKLSDTVKMEVAKFVNKRRYVRSPNRIASLLGAGTRRIGKLGPVIDFAVGLGSYLGTRELQDWVRNKF